MNNMVALWFDGPRAVLISGALVDVDLADAPTVLAARGRIAAAVGIPIGRVQLVDTSAHTQLDDAVRILDDVQVVLLILDVVLERAALARCCMLPLSRTWMDYRTIAP